MYPCTKQLKACSYCVGTTFVAHSVCIHIVLFNRNFNLKVMFQIGNCDFKSQFSYNRLYVYTLCAIGFPLLCNASVPLDSNANPNR